VGLASGFSEGNALLAGAGNGVPIVGLLAKFSLKSALVEAGVKPESVNRGVERVGWFGTGANIATIAGLSGPLAILVGLGVGFVADQELKVKEQECTALREGQ